MATQAVVVDPDGHSASTVCPSVGLCLSIGCRPFHIYALLSKSTLPRPWHCTALRWRWCVSSVTLTTWNKLHNRCDVRKMKRETSVGVLLVFCSVLFSLGIVELAIRYFGTYDENGSFLFAGRTQKPYKLPVTTTRKAIDEYLSSSSSRLMYDPDLGWTPRPNGQSRDGLYHYNSIGIRSAPSEYSMAPQPGVLRIALFGDSYTHGDDVPFENSWGYYLENNLEENGIQAEVINFGVSAYGTDQAFLRWQKLGRKLSPDIVILGFDAENVNRNVNLIRPIYKPSTRLPFSKPRFVLDGERLRVINIPVLSPENVVDVMQNIETWDFVEHEYFFDPKDYQDSIWLKSKLVALALSLGSDQGTKQHLYSLDEEPAQLTLEIIQEFRKDVEADGRRFLVVHLPRRSNMATILAGDTLEYAELLAEIAKTNTVVYPEYRLLEEAKSSSLEALFKGHYSARGNRVIADAIAEFLISSSFTPP